MPTIIEQHRDKLEALCKKHHITYLALFGSYARGDNTPDSDVDLLVEFAEGYTKGLAFFGVKEELSNVLQHDVDLVEKAALNRHIAPYIEDDLTTIYETEQ